MLERGLATMKDKVVCNYVCRTDALVEAKQQALILTPAVSFPITES
jgi:hypothetical protein